MCVYIYIYIYIYTCIYTHRARGHLHWASARRGYRMNMGRRPSRVRAARRASKGGGICIINIIMSIISIAIVIISIIIKCYYHYDY